MQESEPIREIPKSVDVLLAPLGMKEGDLIGKDTVSIGASLEGRVPGADITDFTEDDYDYYIASDGELSIQGNRDLILVTDPLLRDALGNPDTEEYLAAVTQLLRPETGELRIASPYISPELEEDIQNIHTRYQDMLQEKTGLPIRVTYGAADTGSLYLSVQIPEES